MELNDFLDSEIFQSAFQVFDEIDKRAPMMGFQGMRGKKIYPVETTDDYEKRAVMMGFQGMRGKKDEVDADWDKRAPMGFQGMRGKKNLQEEIEELEKRAVMGFQVNNYLILRN